MNTGAGSELTVVTRAKELGSYIITVTQKSPKQYRFTFVIRMQNLALEIIENIYRANETFPDAYNRVEKLQRRLDYQHQAITNIRLLAYLAELALEHKCILPHQYEQIAKLATDCLRLLGGWINSDKKRLEP